MLHDFLASAFLILGVYGLIRIYIWMLSMLLDAKKD